MNLQRRILEKWYTISFGLVPLQLGAIVAGLLCSNHVTYRFGKGMMPKMYQLNPDAIKLIVDQYAKLVTISDSLSIFTELLLAKLQNSTAETLLPM